MIKRVKEEWITGGQVRKEIKRKTGNWLRDEKEKRKMARRVRTERITNCRIRRLGEEKEVGGNRKMIDLLMKRKVNRKMTRRVKIV